MTQPEGALPITALHLAREIARTDTDIEHWRIVRQWGRVEALEAYRERLAIWRYALLRGVTPTHLVRCPSCLAIHRLVSGGMIDCFRCGHDWMVMLEGAA